MFLNFVFNLLKTIFSKNFLSISAGNYFLKAQAIKYVIPMYVSTDLAAAVAQSKNLLILFQEVYFTYIEKHLKPLKTIELL